MEERKRRFDLFFSRYRLRVLNCAFQWANDKTEAEDVVMEAFSKLWINLDKVEVGKEYAWIYITTRRLCLDASAKRQRHPQDSLEQMTAREEELGDILKRDDPGPVEIAAAESLKSALEDCIQNLPPEFRVIVMHRLDEKTLDEIRKLTGNSQGTTSYRYYEALKRLQKCLAGKGYFNEQA